MKVAILMLSYERYDTLVQVLPNNLQNAGCSVDLFILDQGSKDPRVLEIISSLRNGDTLRAGMWHFRNDNIGIAAGFNYLLRQHPGYDAYQFMANDILEQPGWVAKKVEYLKAIPDSGMVSIPCGDHGYPSRKAGGLWLHPGDVIGQFMISRQVYEKVGAFREDFGKYGPVDNDYNIRCAKAGFTNYYLPGMKAVHLDDHANDLYGYDKAAAVAKSWPEFMATVSDQEYFIAPEDYNINAKEYV